MVDPTLDACLPDHLRGATIARVSVGLSGAGVYRVDTPGGTYILKVADADDPGTVAAWRQRIAIQRAAADAEVAPQVIHVDEVRRAVVSELVTDHGFLPRVATPATRDAAIAQLGRTLRRVHDLPLPAGAPAPDPRALLAATWTGLAGFATPGFVAAAVRRVLDAAPLPSGRPVVVSHNDVNPTNVVDAGGRLVLIDWDAAGAGDPLYDLAAIAAFLRFDDDAAAALVAAHDHAPVAALPAAFHDVRRLIATLCGAMFVHLARAAGHPGDAAAPAPDLGEVYQRMRGGALSVATADGRWAFGLGLIADAR